MNGLKPIVILPTAFTPVPPSGAGVSSDHLIKPTCLLMLHLLVFLPVVLHEAPPRQGLPLGDLLGDDGLSQLGRHPL